MPSGGTLFPGSLARRVRHLERSIQPDLHAQRRAYLAQFFASSEYDGHREALLEALCSDAPCPRYEFYTADRYYLINWGVRHHPPLVYILPADLAHGMFAEDADAE